MEREAGSTRRVVLLAAAIVFLVGFVLYADTLGYDFVWDDYDLIVDNAAVRTFDAPTVLGIFAGDFWKVTGPAGGYYRPLVALSYHIDYALYGNSAGGFHLTNVLLNALTGVLVFLFTYLLFGGVVVGVVTALIFTVHPVHTEAVAWISGRTDILATLWVLVSLCCYISSRRRCMRRYLAASLVAFMLAMFSKETAACVPFLILLLETRPFAPLLSPGTTGNTRRTFAIALAFFAVLALYLILRRLAIGAVASSYPAFAPGALGRVALPLSILGGYVYKVLLPHTLSAEYDAPIPTSFADPAVVAGAAVLALILWAAWRFRRRPDVTLAAGVFLLGLAPVMNLIPIGEVSAERFLYLPSLGLAVVLGRPFARALQTKFPSLKHGGTRGAPASGLLVAVFSCIVLVFAYETIARTPDWRDNDILFAKTVAQAPDKERAQAAAGWAAMRRGDVDTAALAYRKALELNPDYALALTGLAAAYEQQGRLEDALRLAERAARLSADDPQLLERLGSLYMSMGRYEEAGERFERLLVLDPDNGAALNNLAVAYARQQRFGQALGPAERALRLSPKDPMRINNLGSLYMDLKQYDKAVEQFEASLRLAPDMPNAHFNLGLIQYEQGNARSARTHFEQAAQGGVDFQLAYFYLAVIDHAAGSEDSAKRWARRFLQGYPQNDAFRDQAAAIAEGGG